MKLISIVAGVALYAGLGGPSTAQGALTGLDLARHCGSRDYGSQMVCTAFVAAVGQTLVILGGETKLCFSRPIENEQMIRIFRSYVASHPEDLHLPAAAVVARSLILEFPCR